MIYYTIFLEFCLEKKSYQNSIQDKLENFGYFNYGNWN